MLKNLKIISPLFFVILITTNSFSQKNNESVSIIASGSGTTLNDAKQNALRSATEQAFGVFISSNTEIFNDQVVADQIASVSIGNIKSFELLNQSQLPNGSWGVTLKALVSLDNLKSFVESKGISVEFKGGLFAINIKQQLLNEVAEIQAISQMVGLLHEPMQQSFNYEIKSLDPKSLDIDSKNWEIPLTVKAITNENINFCSDYIIKTLAAISLSDEEVKSYKKLNKDVFIVYVPSPKWNYTFYLRKQASIDAISTLTNQWPFYTSLFTINSGIDEINGNNTKMEQIHKFSIVDKDFVYGDFSQQTIKKITFYFLKAGKEAATYSLIDKRTLSQIEQMNGYRVEPRGIVSKFKYGGFLVYEKSGHGLVVSIMDIGLIMDWNTAKTNTDNLSINGYNDWILPTVEELMEICKKLNKIGVGNFKNDDYYAPYLGDSKGLYFNFGDYPNGFEGRGNVRPVRRF